MLLPGKIDCDTLLQTHEIEFKFTLKWSSQIKENGYSRGIGPFTSVLFLLLILCFVLSLTLSLLLRLTLLNFAMCIERKSNHVMPADHSCIKVTGCRDGLIRNGSSNVSYVNLFFFCHHQVLRKDRKGKCTFLSSLLKEFEPDWHFAINLNPWLRSPRRTSFVEWICSIILLRLCWGFTCIWYLQPLSVLWWF